jgi:predicted pyridoxine 5'-phosphate oxidase superfamily flavin-nucleotide-binding protein
MGILTDDMKRLIDEQKLAFHATVCPDGSPNLSPKGSTRVWDDDHLFFADICSPQTTANIRAGSLVEVNVVDPFLRKGYRFQGGWTNGAPGNVTSTRHSAGGPSSRWYPARRHRRRPAPSCSCPCPTPRARSA